jgi:hypothetical protein
LVRVAGFEPTTFGSASQRSIQLSYTRLRTGVILTLNFLNCQLHIQAISQLNLLCWI